MSAPTVLVSLCLCGVLCRYHGQRYRMGHDLTLPHSVVARLRAAGYRMVPVCPEVDGGLPVPRPPTRRCNGRLVCGDQDVTEAFSRGAGLALATAEREGCERAYLVRGCPACG